MHHIIIKLFIFLDSLLFMNLGDDPVLTSPLVGISHLALVNVCTFYYEYVNKQCDNIIYCACFITYMLSSNKINDSLCKF